MTVIPIHTSNYEEGCGFFISRYFITSGHVITDSENPRIFINGTWLNLTNPIFYEDNRVNPHCYDLAVFDVKKEYGDLELFTGEVVSGMVLKSNSFKELGVKYVECEVEVNDYKEGNYFGGLSSINLKSGCSGSPVLIDNKVVGMMTGGNNNDCDIPMNPALPLNFCVFLSADAIRKVL